MYSPCAASVPKGVNTVYHHKYVYSCLTVFLNYEWDIPLPVEHNRRHEMHL